MVAILGSQALEFIQFLENVGIPHIIQSDRGRDGGTWAHWQIGLASSRKPVAVSAIG